MKSVTFRLPRDLVEHARRCAVLEDRTLTSLVVRAIRLYTLSQKQPGTP